MIFNLHLGVGQSVLCQMGGVGHVFSNQHFTPLCECDVLITCGNLFLDELTTIMEILEVIGASHL